MAIWQAKINEKLIDIEANNLYDMLAKLTTIYENAIIDPLQMEVTTPIGEVIKAVRISAIALKPLNDALQ